MTQRLLALVSSEAAMLDELAGQLQRVGAHIADVSDALGLTAAKIGDTSKGSDVISVTFATGRGLLMPKSLSYL